MEDRVYVNALVTGLVVNVLESGLLYVFEAYKIVYPQLLSPGQMPTGRRLWRQYITMASLFLVTNRGYVLEYVPQTIYLSYVKTHTHHSMSLTICMQCCHIVNWTLRTNTNEIIIDIHIFRSRKCIWKHLFPNGSHFVAGSTQKGIMASYQNTWWIIIVIQNTEFTGKNTQ